jgi:DNA-binding SARP family transcriptional activator/tetratricopeptide (TPR) repeat protein
MEFRILGPLEVRDGERLLPLGGERQRAVLAQLLLDANRVVSVDRLVAGVWGDAPPASALASLQNHVGRLRKELGARLVTQSPGYLLRIAEGELDLDRFLRLVDDARGAEASVAAERLAEALALWRGPPLADLADLPVAHAATHLEELRSNALEDRIDADLALGRHAALVSELEQLVMLAPYRERLRGQLILALYRSRRQADALDAYAAARRTFVDELGTEPGRDLQELQRAVLRRDAALEAPVGVEPSHSRASARRTDERKTVTVLAADVRPADVSDDPEARRAELGARSAGAVRVLERHGATVQHDGGGRVLAVFGVPRVRDDDALQAARAAMALRASGRVGLATGEIVTGEPIVSGTPVDEATSLRERAADGQVLAGSRTWHLVRHAVTGCALDGTWRIEAVDPEAAPLLRHLDTPIVGRRRELEQILEDTERAAAAGRAHLVTIFGAPGIGKTRLALECAHHLAGAMTPVFARCLPAGQESPYAPLGELLGDFGEPDLRTEETAWVVRSLLVERAQDRPLLLVLDDIHWAAPVFLDLIESLVELARAPVIVLCLARPDLLELRPHWGGGRLSSSSVLLDVLTDVEADALLDELTPEAELDSQARARILEVAEGNPLFIEQLLAAALEGGGETVPDTIQTLLAARLDRLDEQDRTIAQVAAVAGTSFTQEEVAELAEVDPSESLLTLERRELVRLDDSSGNGWSFRHGLIRDVAYGSLTKRRRAELHERLAERATDVDLTAGYHLDQAVRARRESGERGAAVERLAARAAGHLSRAGGEAFDRDDMIAAVELLSRANEILPRDSRDRLELLSKLATALVYCGNPDAAHELIAEAGAVAAQLGDERLKARATLGIALTLLWTDEALPAEQMLEDIERAFPVLERAGDYEGLATAEALRFHALLRAGSRDPGARFPLALEYARRANARHFEHYVLGWVCITLPHGTLPVDDAIARAAEIRDLSTSEYVRASAIGAIGLLRAMQGDFEEARALVQTVRGTLEQLDLRQAAAAHSIAISEVESMAGDDAAAERILRDGYEAVTALGDEHSAMNVAWRLALALARQGKNADAERFVRVAERAEPKSLWVDVWWRVVAARIAANRGERDAARELVEASRARMGSMLESGMQADVLLESADALRVSGLADEAASLTGEAAGIAERLGYSVALRRADNA